MTGFTCGFQFKFNGKQPAKRPRFVTEGALPQGTSVAVYGSIDVNNTAVSTYTIDQASPVTFTSMNMTAYTSNQLFFQSPQLQDGEHTLAMFAPSAIGNDAATQVHFDFLTFIPSLSSSSSPAVITVQSPHDGMGMSKGDMLGAIIPAVLIPTLVMLAALFSLAYYFHRRWARLFRVMPDVERQVFFAKVAAAECKPSHTEFVGLFIQTMFIAPSSSTYQPSLRRTPSAGTPPSTAHATYDHRRMSSASTRVAEVEPPTFSAAVANFGVRKGADGLVPNVTNTRPTAVDRSRAEQGPSTEEPRQLHDGQTNIDRHVSTGTQPPTYFTANAL